MSAPLLSCCCITNSMLALVGPTAVWYGIGAGMASHDSRIQILPRVRQNPSPQEADRAVYITTVMFVLATLTRSS